RLLQGPAGNASCRLRRGGGAAEGQPRELRGAFADGRPQANRSRVRPTLPARPCAGGDGNSREDRRQAGGAAFRDGRERRLYPGPRLLSPGQHEELRRLRRARAATAWPVEARICRPDAAREFERLKAAAAAASVAWLWPRRAMTPSEIRMGGGH